MLNRKNKLLIITCFTALFFSCSKDDFCNCLKGTGATTTQEREVEPFTDIQMENNVDVIFTQSNIYSLSVTCGSNIIDGIETRVEGSTLYIRNKNKCNWLRDFNNQFTVQVSGPDLNLLTTTGSGNFTNTDTLTTGEIKIESKDGSGIISVTVTNSFLEAAVHTGPADIIISGSTRGFGAYSAGTGFTRASGLASD